MALLYDTYINNQAKLAIMLKKISFFIATGFFSGLSKKMPGTIGSLVYLGLWCAICNGLNFNDLEHRLIVLTILFIVGNWSTNLYLKDSKETDPQVIVIDEWIGLHLALMATSSKNILEIFFTFILFRIFDILKPMPAKKLEKLPGAYGVIADDLLAGLYTLVIIFICRKFY